VTLAVVLQGTADRFPDAIHDTVGQIASGSAYAVRLGQSLLERFLTLVVRAFNAIFDAAERVPHGRYIAIGCAVVIILALVARAVFANRLRDALVRMPGSRGAGVRMDPWAEARRLAAAGQYTDAAHALYSAVLDRLAERDRLRLHPSLTSGDYARQLRRAGSGAYGAFQIFGRHFDRVIFGVGHCDADDFAALAREAEPILAEARAA
jgi:hypothetical protein